MATFPAYASLLFDGFGEKRESGLLRSEMESGPPKQAKIKSRVMVKRPVGILVKSLADYNSFISWFSTTINEGADWFDWTDPVTNATKSARFVEGGLDSSPLTPVLNGWVIKAAIETWG